MKNVKPRLWIASILLLCILSASAQQKDQRVTINLTNASLKDVFNAVEKQTTYHFSYRNVVIDSRKDITINKTNETVASVLNDALKGRDLEYSIISDRSIVISDKQKNLNDKRPKHVRGEVKDAGGEPLIGVSVIIKGTTSGSLTDVDGSYQITTDIPNPTLVFTYVGYGKQEFVVGNQTVINVTMHDDSQMMDEVVVTALGIKRAQKALSYNVQTVNSDELTTIKSTNIMNSLAGKVAGVNISSSSSGLGGATRVVMRGTKSLEQNNNALYVIDGLPMYNYGGGGSMEFGSTGATEPIADINPEDIESVSVLTGAAAAALYGNQGSNGAIVITTKRGNQDRLEVNFSSSVEALSTFIMPEFQNRYGTGVRGIKEDVNVKSWGQYLAPENRYDYDPDKDFLKTGTTFTNSVSIATGNARNQTYFSAAVVNANGIVPNNQYDRYNFTFRNTAKFLNDKMTFDFGASYIIQNDLNMRNQGVYSNPIVSAYLFPRGTDFAKAKMFERYDPVQGINVQFWDELVGSGDYYQQNPYWITYRNLVENKKKRYMLNASLSYDVLDWLNVSGRVRIDNSHTNGSEKYYASTISTLANPYGKMAYSEWNYEQIYADVLANINKKINEDFGLVANIGASINDVSHSGQSVWGQIRLDGIPNVFLMEQADPNQRGESVIPKNHQQSQAIFASAELNYKSLYFLTLTARNDWESALAGSKTNTLSFFYPSVGLSAILSDIIPMMPKQISYMKLRGSYSQVGNPIPNYIAKTQYEFVDGVWENKSIFPLYDAKPERTDSWEIGLNTRFLKNFNFDFAWYYALSKNQTYNPDITPSSGYKKMYVQTGSIRNTGIELTLGYSNKWRNFGWSSNFTYSMNRNKIKKLIDKGYSIGGFVLPDMKELERGGIDRAKFILKPGGTLGDLYSYKDFVRDNKGDIYIDENGSPITQDLSGDQRIYLGSILPKGNLSWRNNFSWKNINLGFLVTARLGGIVYSQTQSALDYYGVSEASANARDNGGIPINGGLVDAEKYYSVVSAVSNALPQNYVYDATNVRLQELSIGYMIPRKWLGNVADVNISFIAHNLWMIYCKAPFDPEMTANTTNSYYQGIDYFMMPSLRNIGVSLKAKF